MDTNFEEGFALKDAGAFFINNIGEPFEMNCKNFTFKNIYTNDVNSSAIAF